MAVTVSDLATLPNDLADLRAFCLVVDQGSFTAAGKLLGETTGSISRRISRLEAALGTALVLRSPRAVRATDEGAEFRARVQLVLDALEAAACSVQHTKERPRGALRITAPSDLTARVLSPHLASFARDFPEVQLELILSERKLDFDTHQLDFAFRAATALDDSSLIAYRLRDLGVLLAASPRYLEERKAPRNPDALREHPLFLMDAPGGSATIRFVSERDRKRAAVRVRPRIVARDGAVLRELALSGEGIALLPREIAEADLREGALAEVLPRYGLDLRAGLFLLHRSAPYMPAKSRAFRDHMLAAFEKRRGARARAT